ncbi:glycoside hydrolase family 76 protein [Actinomadura alba]|uniref:Glycoside hydrolase family 76 protein n=1 Tax=Actinomadura alba TaxID=406431 RepID=A0ABR7LTT2_9ACTN|nr:glycoside hydrolase family 76 protein [Actinomadura alba]MBC6468259.1 glycoside hydrolase family 76 protein [Actinomadura alba]
MRRLLARLRWIVAFTSVLLGGAIGAGGVPPAAADLADVPGGQRAAARAEASYRAMRRFLETDRGLYLETSPRAEGGNPYSYVWPYSQAMAGALTMAGLRDGRRYAGDVADRLRALELYWNPETDPPGYDSYVRPPLGQGGDKFYDDNEWIGLALVQHHKRTGDAAALARAERIFDLVVHGWDTDPSNPCPGGVFWTQAPWSQDRNTVSNGPGAELGLHLYLLTKRPEYLAWAKRMFDWTNACMLAPNGLYWDHIDLAGRIDTTQWSYNQGVMLGSAALLYKATGDHRYLDRARDIATAAIAFYSEDDRWFTQPARFNAIFFKNLLILDGVAPGPSHRRVMKEYADRVWTEVRDPRTGIFPVRDLESGLFDFSGGGDQVTLLEQAAMVQIYGLLGWSPRDYPLLA